MTQLPIAREQLIPAALRHADARAAQQRAATADRRAATLAGLVETSGGQQEAADLLGISKAAVSKALVNARSRQLREPVLADFAELDLPACAVQVPTVQEWQAMEGDEQLVAAERAVQTWAALTAMWGRLYRETHSAGEWLASVRIGYADPDEEEDAAQRPALLTDADVAAVRAQDHGTYSPQITVLGDIARALQDQAQAAMRAHDWWQSQVDNLGGLFE